MSDFQTTYLIHKLQIQYILLTKLISKLNIYLNIKYLFVKLNF